MNLKKTFDVNFFKTFLFNIVLSLSNFIILSILPIALIKMLILKKADFRKVLFINFKELFRKHGKMSNIT